MLPSISINKNSAAVQKTNTNQTVAEHLTRYPSNGYKTLEYHRYNYTIGTNKSSIATLYQDSRYVYTDSEERCVLYDEHLRE
ncbi:MAG: hypothetical protein LPK09_06485 [Hymenobacteraceae bacterium]|nr:hypothetical protein [Hymenobacteraceae bacterium]